MEISGIDEATSQTQEWPVDVAVKPIFRDKFMRDWKAFDGFYSEEQINICPHKFEPEFIEAFKTEKTWIRVDKVPSIERDDAKAIGLKLKECPVCDDRRSIMVRVRGKNSGIPKLASYSCECVRYLRFYPRMLNLPEESQRARISLLSPSDRSTLSAKRQQKIISHIRANTDDRYFLYGETGAGKSYLGCALYLRALGKWAGTYQADQSAVMRVSTTEMIDEWMSYRLSTDKPRPRVQVSSLPRLKIHGIRPFLLLEEIDKLSVNENRLAKLYEIVNGYHECDAQLVVTSNTSPDTLIKAWDRFPGNFGSTIMRRLAQPPWGTVVHFRENGT